MEQKNSQNGVSSMLRDKYLAKSLSNTLKLNNQFPLFSTLGGVDYLKEMVTKCIYNPLFKKNKFKSIGANPPSTLLFHGVSGVGKTFLVNCISQEFKVPIVIAKLDNEREIRESFRKGEVNECSIILVENVDQLNIEDDKKVIQQLSSLLNDHEGKSIVIATAEHLTSIPSSLRKFDNEVLVRIPTLFERKKIFTSVSAEFKIENVDWDEIARMTPGYVARDLVRLLKIAANIAVSKDKNFISQEDLLQGLREQKNNHNLITFDDIGSLEMVKEELKMSIILPSLYPQKFRRLGICKPSGVLLYGPPGCGKTLLARAVSNMSHCNFISVKGPELISKYVGDSEKEIRKLFDKAKQLQPCIIFFDEIDSLCSKRSSYEFENRIVNQILTLFDGLEDRGEVYVIGATNRLMTIDEAFLRPGRFDKIIEVPLPDIKGCMDIFLKTIANIPVENFDFSELMLEGFSGADIAGIVKEAGLLCLKENFKSDTLVIRKKNFEDAIARLRAKKIKL